MANHLNAARQILRGLPDWESFDDADAQSWADLGERLTEAGRHATEAAKVSRLEGQVNADFGKTGRGDEKRI
jgi:hypothetical protein